MTEEKKKELQWVLDNPYFPRGSDDLRFSNRLERGPVFLQDMGELEFLLSQIKQPPKKDLWIAEVGTGKAGTTAQMAAYQAIKGYNLRVMTCATAHPPEIDIELESVRDYVTYYHLPSWQAFFNWQSDFSSPEIWFLFLDGGHAYHHVVNELWTFGKLVVPGGRVMIHDTQENTEYGRAETTAIRDFIKWNPGKWREIETPFDINKLITRI